jgi:formate dehydrogenase subunit gamma
VPSPARRSARACWRPKRKALLGIDFHQTTADRCITLEPVYCLGNCACSPAIRIDDEIHGMVDARVLAALLEDLRTQLIEVR